MMACQIQLREDMNLIVQKFQNLKGFQEENKTDQNPPISNSEKKINEKISKMEEMIKRARKMQDVGLGQVQWHRLPQIPPKDVHEGYVAPRSY